MTLLLFLKSQRPAGSPPFTYNLIPNAREFCQFANSCYNLRCTCVKSGVFFWVDETIHNVK